MKKEKTKVRVLKKGEKTGTIKKVNQDKKKPVKKIESSNKIVKIDPEKKEIISTKEKSIQSHTPTSLLAMAVQNGMSVDQLKELIKMKNDEEDRESEKIFNEKFCEMQSTFPVIKQINPVKNKEKTRVLYSYAPLKQAIKQIKGILKEFGFSYYFTEEAIKDNWKRVHCHVSGHGHERSAYVDIPVMQAGKMTNITQQIGAASTYGKRYALFNVLGLVTDDDTDGAGDDNKERSNLLATIKANLDKLKITSFKEVQKKTGVQDFNTAPIVELRKASTILKKEILNNIQKPGTENKPVEKKAEPAEPEKSVEDYLNEAEKLSVEMKLKPSEFDKMSQEVCKNGISIDGMRILIKKLNDMKKGVK